MAKTPANIKKLPKQARAIRRMEAILNAALDILLKEGIDAVTTTRIAKSADVPVGSVYQYFDSRDDVLDYLYAKSYNEIVAVVEKAVRVAPEGLNFVDLSRLALTTFWDATKNNKSFRILTRWSNSQHTLWESTPGLDSSLPDIITLVLSAADMNIPSARAGVALNSLSAIISLMIDLAIEQEDEAQAYQYIEELLMLLEAYIGTFAKT